MKKYNPTSPARRQMEVVDWKKILTQKDPHGSLTFGWKRAVGRNNRGRITTRHKGGGVKRLWRNIDFIYDKKDIPARITSLEYDPNRTSFIALVQYRDGEKRYVLASANLKVGDEIIVSENAPLEAGNRTILGRVPIGSLVYNVELRKGSGAQLVRSAGAGAMVLAQEGGFTDLQLPSKEVRRIRSDVWASIGTLSNPEHNYMVLGKAGRSRRLRIRPTVRGTAMNPVDHPHGGGEGRSLIGRRRGPATPWGKPARGVKTRGRKRHSDKYIISRRRR